MKSAGFSERESETMLWKGITGWSKEELLPLAQKRASEFFGKPISNAQAEAIVNDRLMSSIPKETRLKNLTDAGFTPQQAQEIMDMKLNSAARKALASKGLTPAERKTLTENYEKIIAKCKNLPFYAAQAGLNGASIQSNLNTGVSKSCND